MKTSGHSAKLVAPDNATAPLSTSELANAEDQFLAALGRRVRELRERQGLTRKFLAQQADVSERYLGQLESGDGNVSIVLLRRIASALDVGLRDMLPDEHGEAHVRRHRIALIGLRGAGKTALGSMLAAALSVPFIELDREIEHDMGLPVSEIFTLYGQAGYRRTERRCLERVLAEHDRAVIAVGGGIVSEEETFQLLLRHCHTVWLKATPEEHMARVIAQGDYRPMAGNAEAMEDLKRILTAREPLYEKADAIVNTSRQTLEESFAALQQLVRREIKRNA
jgi:XRE family aerobic/anaerobic benzoate catabolism transcriptional regulator